MVPKDLRPYLDGKTELRAPPGADRRLAIRQHAGALATLQHRMAEAERKKAIATGEPELPGRYPLAPSELAAANYRERLRLDEDLRLDQRYAAIGIDDLLIGRLREAIAGRLSDEELLGLVGDRVDRCRRAPHRFKTVCRELEISDRVADAITGHAGRVAGDEYGDVTIATKAAAIRKLPPYPVVPDASSRQSGH